MRKVNKSFLKDYFKIFVSFFFLIQSTYQIGA